MNDHKISDQPGFNDRCTVVEPYAMWPFAKRCANVARHAVTFYGLREHMAHNGPGQHDICDGHRDILFSSHLQDFTIIPYPYSGCRMCGWHEGHAKDCRMRPVIDDG